MSIINELKNYLKEVIKAVGYDLEEITFIESSRKDLGDYQINDAMRLAKTYHESPIEIANKIVEVLKDDSHFVNVNIAGPGFINLTLSSYFLNTCLNRILEDFSSNIDFEEPKKILMDYGGANIAKTLHVGHLRSANIGEAIKRLARYLGYEVISDVHFGDIGRQTGMVISEIKRRNPNLDYFNSDYKGNYEDIEFTITPEELGEIYPTANIAAKCDENRMQEVIEITKEVEEGNKAYLALWNKIKEVSIKDIKNIYKDINTTFDLYEGESDCYPYISKILDHLEKGNYLRKSENAKVIDIKNEEDNSPMPPLIIEKSNGGTLYATRELATMYSRIERFTPDEIWYFADERQSLYFEQVFRVAKKTNLAPPTLSLNFYGFGTMNSSDGKPFKTRDGNVMSLKELIDILEKETTKKLNKDIVEKEKQKETSKIIAIAALKYADLIPYRETNYIFDPQKFTNLEGKTGPYILYSTIRMKSLLNKASYDKYVITKLKNKTDKTVALELLKLPQVLTRCLEQKSLNELTDYIYKLTSSYNTFYNEFKVLTENDQSLKISWLALTKLVYTTNITILEILGITVPEKM